MSDMSGDVVGELFQRYEDHLVDQTLSPAEQAEYGEKFDATVTQFVGYAATLSEVAYPDRPRSLDASPHRVYGAVELDTAYDLHGRPHRAYIQPVTTHFSSTSRLYGLQLFAAETDVDTSSSLIDKPGVTFVESMRLLTSSPATRSNMRQVEQFRRLLDKAIAAATEV